MNSDFLIKLRTVHDRNSTLLRRWFTMDFLLMKKTFSFFLKTDSFRTYSKKNPQNWSLSTVGMQFYWKKLHHIIFLEKLPNLRNQLLSVTSSLVLKRQITWKITWKVGVKSRKKNDSSTFLRWVLVNIKHLLESNRRNKTVHKAC